MADRKMPSFIDREKYRKTQVVHVGEILKIGYNGCPSPAVIWSNISGPTDNPPTTGTDEDCQITWLRAEKVKHTTILRYTITLKNDAGIAEMMLDILIPGAGSLDKTLPQKGMSDKTKSILKWVGIGGAAVASGIGAIVATPLVLGAVGFTSAGVAAGSLAAGMMSSAAIANGGAIAAGSTVAVLQSIGAAGLGAVGATAVGGTAAATVGGAATAISAGVEAVMKKSSDKQAPRFLDEERYSQPQRVRVGETLEIFYEGNPPPSVEWVRLRENTEDTPSLETDNSREVVWMRAEEAHASSEVSYMITLENELGTAELEVNVTILGGISETELPALKDRELPDIITDLPITALLSDNMSASPPKDAGHHQKAEKCAPDSKDKEKYLKPKVVRVEKKLGTCPPRNTSTSSPKDTGPCQKVEKCGPDVTDNKKCVQPQVVQVAEESSPHLSGNTSTLSQTDTGHSQTGKKCAPDSTDNKKYSEPKVVQVIEGPFPHLLGNKSTLSQTDAGHCQTGKKSAPNSTDNKKYSEPKVVQVIEEPSPHLSGNTSTLPQTDAGHSQTGKQSAPNSTENKKNSEPKVVQVIKEPSPHHSENESTPSLTETGHSPTVEKCEPDFIDKQKYLRPQVVRVGEKLEIHYVGCPTPNVSWESCDGDGVISENIRTDSDSGVTTMSIKKAVGTQRPSFKVTLINELGQAQMKVKVIVLGQR